MLNDRSLIDGEPIFTVHHDLPASRRAAAQARRFVADSLETNGLTDEIVYTAQLLVSELVTNAVLHARTELHLGIRGDGARVVIAVADGHPHGPPNRNATLPMDYDESGRGMTIVASLADDFGWRQRLDGLGKIMWVTLDTTDTTLTSTDPSPSPTT